MTDSESLPSVGGNAATQHDVIVFLPGIDPESPSHDLVGMASRLRDALDREAATGAARFSLETRDVEYGKEAKTKACTILRTDGTASAPVLEMFMLDYAPNLSRRFEGANLLMKALYLFAALAGAVPVLAGVELHGQGRGKTRKERHRVWYMLGILSLLVIYLGIIGVAVFQVGAQARATLVATAPAPAKTRAPFAPGPALDTAAASRAARAKPDSMSPPRASTASSDAPAARDTQAPDGAFGKLSIFVVVLFTAISTLLPPRNSMRDWVSRSATAYLSLVQYLRLGEGRSLAIGQLEALMEHIVEREGPPPARLHLMGYSFGSILTLDALFPKGAAPSQRLSKIHTLVTIGCPFDLVRTYWPKYFDGRVRAPGAPSRWLNVYTPIDIMASNFRNDPTPGPAEVSVALASGEKVDPPRNLVHSPSEPSQEPSWFDEITLLAMRAHAMYWETEPRSETSCFGLVVREMYAGEPILR